MRRAKGVDEDTDGLSHADSVSQLDAYFVGDTGSDDVLSDVTSGIGCRAVYLRGVLTRESSPAVRSLPPIGVHYDLATREPGIAVRAPDDELTRGVHIQLEVSIECLLDLLGVAPQDTWEEDLTDVLGDTSLHLSVSRCLRLW